MHFLLSFSIEHRPLDTYTWTQCDCERWKNVWKVEKTAKSPSQLWDLLQRPMNACFMFCSHPDYIALRLSSSLSLFHYARHSPIPRDNLYAIANAKRQHEFPTKFSLALCSLRRSFFHSEPDWMKKRTIYWLWNRKFLLHFAINLPYVMHWATRGIFECSLCDVRSMDWRRVWMGERECGCIAIFPKSMLSHSNRLLLLLWLNFIWEIACYKPITAPGINIDIDHSIRCEATERFLSQCRCSSWKR